MGVRFTWRSMVEGALPEPSARDATIEYLEVLDALRVRYIV